MGSVLVFLVGFWLVPSLGLAWVEMGDGEPEDGLGSRGSEGDPVDGLDGPAAPLLGDPGDGLAFPGDPDDGIDNLKIYCDLGDFVLGYEVTTFFGYFRVP